MRVRAMRDPPAMCFLLLRFKMSFLLANPIATFLSGRSPERKSSSAWRLVRSKHSSEASPANYSNRIELISPSPCAGDSCKLPFRDCRPFAEASVARLRKSVAGHPTGTRTQNSGSLFKMSQVYGKGSAWGERAGPSLRRPLRWREVAPLGGITKESQTSDA